MSTAKRSGMELRDIDETTLTVRLNVNNYEKRDGHGTMFLPGAFKQSITRALSPNSGYKVRHLIDHDKKQRVAVMSNAEESNRLEVVSQFAKNSTRSKDHFEEIVLGLHEFSVGFYVVEADETDSTIFREAELAEYSSVWIGSNAGTGMLGFRDSMENLKKMEDAMRKGSRSDERFEALERQVIELRAYIEKHFSGKTSDGTHISVSTSKQVEELPITTDALNEMFGLN